MKKHYESPSLLVTRIELGVFGDYGCGGSRGRWSWSWGWGWNWDWWRWW